MQITINGEPVSVRLHPIYTHYAASRDGRIYTQPAIRLPGLPRTGPRPRAEHWVEVSQFTVQSKHTPPYKKFRITQDGITKLASVHRFMLECWVGIRPRSQVARHLDGVPTHNELGNLKYGTVQENVEDAFRHIGNYAEGVRNGRARLTEADVLAIRRRFDSGESVASIRHDYPRVTCVSVANAAKRKTWAHL